MPHEIQRDTPSKQESASGQLHPHEVVDLAVVIILAAAVSQQMLSQQQTCQDQALERKMKQQLLLQRGGSHSHPQVVVAVALVPGPSALVTRRLATEKAESKIASQDQEAMMWNNASGVPMRTPEPEKHPAIGQNST